MDYKMLSVIRGDINTYFYIHCSGMYTSSYTLYASHGSKCAPSCFHFHVLLNIDGYGCVRIKATEFCFIATLLYL